MRKTIERIPLPLAGPMLGFAAMGGVIENYSETAKLICVAISVCLLVLLLLKIGTCLDMVKEELEDPVNCSIFAAFSMGLLMLTAYLKPYVGDSVSIIWILALAVHVYLLVYFNGHFIYYKFNIKNVYASFFIFYAGLAMSSMTAPNSDMREIGRWFFWAGFLFTVIIAVPIIKRYVKVKEIPEQYLPLICIFAAPASLLLAGYLYCFENPMAWLVIGLTVLALVLYVLVLAAGLKYIVMPFNPSFAAYTFPFVISAAALKEAFIALNQWGYPVTYLKWIVDFQTVLAVALLIYVTLLFLKYIFYVKSE